MPTPEERRDPDPARPPFVSTAERIMREGRAEGALDALTGHPNEATARSRFARAMRKLRAGLET